MRDEKRLTWTYKVEGDERWTRDDWIDPVTQRQAAIDVAKGTSWPPSDDPVSLTYAEVRVRGDDVPERAYFVTIQTTVDVVAVSEGRTQPNAG